MTKIEQTIQDLNDYSCYEEALAFIKGNGMRSSYEAGYRGGHFGASASSVCEWMDSLGLPASNWEHYMPGKLGAYCNYLGGGMRGSIGVSTFHRNWSYDVPQELQDVMDAFLDMCRRAYQSMEDEMNMNDETDEDGETNWDAIATNAARAAGIESAY